MKLLQMIESKHMILLGKIFETLYRTPLVGETIVRIMARSFGRMIFYSPLLDFKRSDTVSGVRRQLEALTSNIGIPISVTREGGDELEFLVHQCPYRFCRSDQQGVCDAAMDIDRLLFRLCGAELIILEASVHGAPECKILMRKI